VGIECFTGKFRSRCEVGFRECPK